MTAALTVQEIVVAVPVLVAVVWWTLRDGLMQAGTRSDQAHVLVLVIGAIVVRLAVALMFGMRQAASADGPSGSVKAYS
jgi:hypothetical protein